MLSDSQAVTTLPVSDLPRARSFYLDRLGLKLREEDDQELHFECAEGSWFCVFMSQGAASGTHTQMAFHTADIERDVSDLRAQGVTFEDVDMPDVEGHDGIYERDGERAAWFRDPEGNLLSVAQTGR